MNTFETNLNKFFELNKTKISSVNYKEKVLILDRSQLYNIIRSCTASIIYNEIYNFSPIVLTKMSKNSWQTKLYKSFGIKEFIFLNLKSYLFNHSFEVIKSIYFAINYIFLIQKKGFKYFIDNFSINGANCADLIYDNYVRDKLRFLNPSPFNFAFIKILFLSILDMLIIDKILNKKKIKVVFCQSHMHTNLSSLGRRVAAKKKVPVLILLFNKAKFFKNYQTTLMFLDKYYKEDLNKIPNSSVSMENIEEYFSSRMKGNIEAGSMYVQSFDIQKAHNKKKELSKEQIIKLLNINENKIKKINLFAAHLFSDFTHFGGNYFLFQDTYSQFIETINKINKKPEDDILWVFKAHPSSPTYNEENIIGDYIKKLNNSNIQLYPEEVSLKSFLKISDKVITGRGNIGVEYASLGKKPIIAGECYYSDFDFAYLPKDKNDYFNAIFDKNFNNHLNNEQIFSAKKIMYLFSSDQNINTGKILPPRFKDKELRNNKNHLLELANKSLVNNSFKEDDYFLELKKFILDWNKNNKY